MNFILAVHESKHTLYLNRSNTPKEVLKEHQISELEVSTEKPVLMAFIQELLDQIDLKPEMDEQLNKAQVHDVLNQIEADPVVEKILENDEFRRMVEQRMPDQPLAWRLDQGLLAFEEARTIINPSKYERIG